MLRFTYILLIFATQFLQAQVAPPPGMAYVGGGVFLPLYGTDSAQKVKAFFIDKYPVTNEEFEAFVSKNPSWNKTDVKRIFADQNYLRQWSKNDSIGVNRIQIYRSPVTNVSWFAAKAYCACQGKRLPTVNEWEFAALASETKADASKDLIYYQRILDWYSKPNPTFLPPVDSSFKNYYGIHGMIGLVWEWTYDFNSIMMSAENRGNSTDDKQLFCASGASDTKDPGNYVAFMRYAFRSSLKANYAVSNLGFRCAQDYKPLKNSDHAIQK